MRTSVFCERSENAKTFLRKISTCNVTDVTLIYTVGHKKGATLCLDTILIYMPNISFILGL